MPNVHASVTGVEGVLRVLGREKQKTGKTIAEILKKCAEIVLKKSQQYVPVETGQLKESGKVVVEGSGMGTRSYVVYDTSYAVYVHENLEAAHAPPTGAKFITRAIRESRGTMANVAKREIEAG